MTNEDKTFWFLNEFTGNESHFHLDLFSISQSHPVHWFLPSSLLSPLCILSSHLFYFPVPLNCLLHSCTCIEGTCSCPLLLSSKLPLSRGQHWSLLHRNLSQLPQQFAVCAAEWTRHKW